MKSIQTSSKLSALSLLAWILAATVFLGCVSDRFADLENRLGLRTPAVNQPIDPQTQQEMDRLYRQGAVALAEGDLGQAIENWTRFVTIAPVHLPRTKDIQGYVTLLRREVAKRHATQAARREAAAQFVPANKSHIAIFPFKYNDLSTGIGLKKNFNRAMLAMITADLSQIPELKLLEREKMDFLMAELKLAQNRTVDPASAARMGRMLGAGRVITGKVSDSGNSGTATYQINTVITSVAPQRVIGVQEANGIRSLFFRLEKEIVYEILQTLGVKKIPAAVDKIHTKNWEAYALFGNGLKLLSENRFAAARQAFLRAMQHDPQFDLAKEAFLSTPEADKNMEQMKAEVEATL